MACPGFFGLAVLMVGAAILVLCYFRHHLQGVWYLLTCRAHRLERTPTGSEWWVMVLTAPIVTITAGYVLILATRAFLGQPQAILGLPALSKGHSLAVFIINLLSAALLEEMVFRLLPLGIFVFLPLYISERTRQRGSSSPKRPSAGRIWCALCIIGFFCGWLVGGFGLACAMVFAIMASRVFMEEYAQWDVKPRLAGVSRKGRLLFYAMAFSAMSIFALGHILNYLPQPPMKDAGAVRAWLMHGLSRFDLYPYVLPQFFSGAMFTAVYLRSPGRWLLPLTASTITHFVHNAIILVVLPLLAGMR